jgi:F0F1-type ATP synthase membrane subunit b/b'
MDFFQVFYEQSPMLLALALGVLVVNIIMVVLLVGIGWYTWKHILSLQKKAGREERDAEVEAEHVLADAQKQATENVQKATKKAQEILQNAATIRDESVRTLTQEITAISEQHQQYLKDASLKYVETYEHMAEQAQEEYLATLHTASQSMAKDAKQTLGMFESYLKDQTVGYTESMEKKIEELRNEANAYVDDYKKNKLQRVDNAIEEIIVMVAKNVIGRSISIKEHNELVLRALSEAKKEGFFSHLEL